MPLVPLTIPPGVHRNGTDFESSNRWRDVNLMRWTDGSMKPVGGWSIRKATAFTGIARAMITWRDNSGAAHIVAATSSNLYHVDDSYEATTVDITPVGFTSGNDNAEQQIGYGSGLYNTNTYGTARDSDGYINITATTWSLDTWGEYLVGCSSTDGKLYEWQLDDTTPTVAAVIANAPTSCLGLVVTEERFLVALGASGNPRLLAWSDREDNTTWTAAATNEAGDLELQTAGQIMQGVRVKGGTLLVTDVDAHIMVYQGPPYVYGIERVGTTCGVASRNAVASVNERAYWMGRNSFFIFDGSSVSEIPCEVSDFVFKDINTNQRSKVIAAHNSQFGEIWWFYPSGASLENDSYVIYDYKENHWNIGEIERTTGVDRGVFEFPIWVDASGNIYNHERVGLSHGGVNPHAETGPISLANGDNVMRATHMYPDEITQGDVTATFKTRFHPNDTEREYGPYTMSNPTSIRFTGRQMRMRVDSTNDADFRVGVMRIELNPGGIR